ncbi:MAG: hypothetical protein NC906_03705 [Candidatus Omnitrophica bacterium]|nr:hypothetical protein [Candidatus Omnitrophota bacterium]
MENFRGSRKHFIDWVSKHSLEFSKELSDLLYPTGAIVSLDDIWMPDKDNFEEGKIGKIDSRILDMIFKKILQTGGLCIKIMPMFLTGI